VLCFVAKRLAPKVGLQEDTALFLIFHYSTSWSPTPKLILLHYTTLHYTTLHYTTLHYTTLHYTTLHYTTLHYTTLHYTTLYLNKRKEKQNIRCNDIIGNGFKGNILLVTYKYLDTTFSLYKVPQQLKELCKDQTLMHGHSQTYNTRVH
jgi:hypothetical protein